MKALIISTVIGIAAGIIDIIPMIIRKLDRRSIASAFLHYLFVGIIIVNFDIPGVVWWLEGIIIACALALPVMIIVSGKDKRAIPAMAVMAVMLGFLISVVGHYFRTGGFND